MSKTPIRIRDWVFTSYSEDPPQFRERMKYLLYAPEICPDTKRHHWQCYVYYYDKVSLKMSNKIIGDDKKHHHEQAYGELNENKSYIIGPYNKNGKKKPYNPNHIIFGSEPIQGSRSDLHELKEKLMAGSTSVDEICVGDPTMFHQYGRTLQKIEDLRMRKVYKTEMTKGIWLWGASGVGKSHQAFEGYSPETHYNYPYDNGWWDGYKQQETCIFNEFRGGDHMTYAKLLNLVDKWPVTVKRRCREPLPFTSKTVIITSSMHPSECYDEYDDQLKRRFDIIEIKKSVSQTFNGKKIKLKIQESE